ncbi:SdpI family protein [Corynebacterium sp. H128]|uniref:SdpI family protein n=1 Tax=Corynebacterium sp. H128 TaxID=3133427 RepID=UPI0030AD064A
MTIFAVLLLVLAAVAIVSGVLGWMKKLPGNGVIGLKVPEVRQSKEIWDAAHLTAGPMWFLAGVSLCFGGLAGLRGTGIGTLIVMAVAVFLAAVLAGIGANNGAKVAHLLGAANKETEGCDGDCNCGTDAAVEKPAVDVAALRKAMEQQ